MSRRYISVELEIAKIDNDCADYVTRKADRWDDAIVSDGSLPDTGFEINTNPTNGDRFLTHIEDLCSGLNRADAAVERCCGMHVHLDARDYSYLDLYKLTRLYALVEDALFSLCAPSRRNGSYSRECASKYVFAGYKTFKQSIIAMLYGEDAAKSTKRWDGKKMPSTSYNKAQKRRVLACFNEKYDSNRYSALNVHSFFYRRTVEFRHFQGTTNATKATSWAMVCAAVMDSASRLTLDQIAALPYDSFDALLAVVPSTLHAWMRERRSTLVASRY